VGSFEISLRNKDVAVWDVGGQVWMIPEGVFEVFVGASSRDLRLNGTFSVEKAVVLKPS